MPDLLLRFDHWYAHQSPVDSQLGDRLESFIRSGELNAAVREAWVIFKTRVVKLFDIPDSLDGHRLADQVFGAGGATDGMLPDGEREGYLNLFKGLYTLSRNPVAHNDIDPSPRDIDAVLSLINSALGRMNQVTTNQLQPPVGAEANSEVLPSPNAAESYVEYVRTSHPRAYGPWSPAEEQQLKSLYESGQSVQTDRINIGASTVRH